MLSFIPEAVRPHSGEGEQGGEERRTFPHLRAHLEGSGSYRQSNSRISLTIFMVLVCLHKT